MKRSRQTINFPPILYPKRSYSRKLISKTAKFPICALRCMSPYCHSIHIATHRLTIACKQNHKNIVQEMPLSESRPGFTPHTFPHRNEAICMYYSDINEDDLEGLPSILTPAMAADTLCVHVNTIYNLLRSGKLSGFRMGAAWRIRKKDLLDFLRQGGSATH